MWPGRRATRAKFGFTALHNIIAGGYTGRCSPPTGTAAKILGLPRPSPISTTSPRGVADLAFVCTPAAPTGRAPGAAPEGGKGRPSSPPGATASRVTRAGEPRGRAGGAGGGAGHSSSPGRTAQGWSPPRHQLCAQIVARCRRPGASRSSASRATSISSFMNYSCTTGIGVGRGSAPATASVLSVGDYLTLFGDDAATGCRPRLPGARRKGRGGSSRRCARSPRSKPVVICEGRGDAGGQCAPRQSTPGRWRARTGCSTALSPARPERCRSRIDRGHGFEAAATFATQPPPRPVRRATVVTTVGGWGVADRRRHRPLLAGAPAPAAVVAE